MNTAIKLMLMAYTFHPQCSDAGNMEWLGASTPVDEDYAEKAFYLCPADSMETLGDVVSPSSAKFGLFVAMNGNGVPDVPLSTLRAQPHD